MPINKSALKRERQDDVRRKRNRVLKSKVRTAFNKINDSIAHKKKEDTETFFKTYMSVVDLAVKKGIFHKNKGARLKSNMAKKINETFKEKTTA